VLDIAWSFLLERTGRDASWCVARSSRRGNGERSSRVSTFAMSDNVAQDMKCLNNLVTWRVAKII
jgi:hypothetical protein